MAAPDVANILKSPGRLAIGPTDLGAAFPHGGTALGITRRARYIEGTRSVPVPAGEFGRKSVEVLYTGRAGILAAVLREWDTDAVDTIFVGASSGVVTDNPKTEAQRPGLRLSDREVKLVFSPLSNQGIRLVMERAIPAPEEAAAIQLRLNSDVDIAVAFEGILISDTGLTSELKIPG